MEGEIVTTPAIEDALEAMLWQFAYKSTANGQRFLHTGGLSALEQGFAALGWDDPHYTDEGRCDVAGCAEWASCVGAYPRSKARDGLEPDKVGFGYLCPAHYLRFNQPNAEFYSDLGRLPDSPSPEPDSEL